MPKKTQPKKKTTTKARTTRRTPKHSSPLGLRVLLGAFDAHGMDEGIAPHPNNFGDVPERAVRALEGTGSESLEDILKDVTEREYPGWEGDKATPTGFASFWVGVATGWYLLTAVNGGGRGGAR